MSEKILYIEDNEQNLYLITFILESHGYEVVQARDGREGIELATDVKPALILLDIQLPLMDGYEVLKRLREKPEVREIPVIALTSHAMVGDREKTLQAGCVEYIEKPINPDIFMDQIRLWLPARPPGGTGG